MNPRLVDRKSNALPVAPPATDRYTYALIILSTGFCLVPNSPPHVTNCHTMYCIDMTTVGYRYYFITAHLYRVGQKLHTYCFSTHFPTVWTVHPVITALFIFHGTQLFSACGAILLSIQLAPFLEDERLALSDLSVTQSCSSAQARNMIDYY